MRNSVAARKNEDNSVFDFDLHIILSSMDFEWDEVSL